MPDRVELKKIRGRRRRLHVRQRITGTTDRPRLTVTKSLRHVTAQLVDDSTRRTLVFWSTMSPGAVPAGTKLTKTEAARQVGKKVAELAIAAGIKSAVFDRNKNRYHGRIRAVAEAAREAGLVI
ncbi:MAG: 50S ribosomal protein L18 [Candidatus Zixiibacteriota bacterium]